METIGQIISDVEVREGAEKVTNDPADVGGRTQYGISEHANPEAWADGKVTEEEARAIYLKKYVSGPKFDLLPSLLQPLCIDWGVVSGPQLVIMRLQHLAGVNEDGVLGPATLQALPSDLRQLNNLLVLERIKQAARIVTKDPSQLKFLVGWVNRAGEFAL